jgi:hypothetical protein
LTPIAVLVGQAISWRDEHKAGGRQIGAAAATIRAHALIDCYRKLGGDVTIWLNAAGVRKIEIRPRTVGMAGRGKARLGWSL